MGNQLKDWGSDNKIRACLLVGLFLTWLPALGLAGSSLPLGDTAKLQNLDAQSEFPEGGRLENAYTLYGNQAKFSKYSSLECENPPTFEDISTRFDYENRLLTRSKAASLGIAWVETSGQQDVVILVRDYKRSAFCIAMDGETQLEYGQSIRTVFTISDWSLNASVTPAILAASASLEHKDHRITINVRGVSDSTGVGEVIAKISGKQFDVDTYADFAAAESELHRLLSKADNKAVDRIGVVVEDVDDSDLKVAVSRSYALKRIEDRNDCRDAVEDFEGPGIYHSYIEEIYTEITGDCTDDRPNRDDQDAAQELLMGVSF